jgi:hypothetical protein
MLIENRGERSAVGSGEALYSTLAPPLLGTQLCDEYQLTVWNLCDSLIDAPGWWE